MKGGARNQPAAASRQPQPPPTQQQAPASPSAKATAKYTNKDGSKFITVPKIATSTSVELAQPSPTNSTVSGATSQTNPGGAGSNGAGPAAVNRKKQKRRAKAAAKAAAEAGLDDIPANGLPSPAASASHDPKQLDPEAGDETDEGDHHSHAAHNDEFRHQENGYTDLPTSKSKKSKKKKKKANAADLAPPPSEADQQSLAPAVPASPEHRGPGISREKIWNTSSQEERERIKEFWLGLGEDERKSLVKVEKDAVLKKMKEQQKHTCSCSVCGRKRTAIEEELEGLYDAYYEELEQFANHPHHHGDPPMMGSSRNFGLHANRGLPANYSGQQPSRGRIVEHVGDDEEEEGEEEYSEEELEEDEYSDEEPQEIHRDYATDFFNFGNSLTVQGGILTVADDLLKNDGKKFIEMMEQLAERRMAREEDAKDQSYARSFSHNVDGADLMGHNHPPPPPPVEEEEYDEEDEEEEEYDSQEEEYDEEEDTMTEEQRMEEGRRMFQIFAARMFEQRVLTAYREKVAKERQAKLFEEIDEESRKVSQRAEKKAKEAQKRKEKAAQKKAALAEEKARKEAEKAAEEEARRKAEAEKAEEARLKAEEKRRKKEAQKKAEEEERLRKEAERQRQREKQAEAERRAREAKDREKKAKEEARLKEKEARERKEREARERKEKQDQDKREKEARSKVQGEAKEKQKLEEKLAQKLAPVPASIPITLPKRPSQHAANPTVPALPQQPLANHASPQIAVATPALPKAPVPVRPRQASSQQETIASSRTASRSGSGTSQNPSPNPNTSVHTSPGPIGPPSKSSVTGQPAPLISQSASPLQSAGKITPASQPGLFNMPPLGMPFPPGLQQQFPPGFGNRMPHDPMFPPPMGSGFRPPNMMSMPPGLGGPVGGRGFPIPHPPPGFPQQSPDQLPGPFSSSLPKDAAPGPHSRQPSGSFESPSATTAQPIARPAPIGRPGSVVQGGRTMSDTPPNTIPTDYEDPKGHLGSSALLDDSEEQPLPGFRHGSRGGTVAPGPRQAFPPTPFGSLDPAVLFQSSSPWGQPAGLAPFPAGPPPPPGFGPVGWASPTPAFSVPGSTVRSTQPRTVTIRQLLCRACRDLSDKARLSHSATSTPDGSSRNSDPVSDVYIPLDSIKSQIELLKPAMEKSVSEDDILALCETEGNHLNGGGSFDVRDEPSGKTIRWVPSPVLAGGSDALPHIQRAVGAPGEIGSPVIGSGWGR
ncbi:Stress response protein NST1 [Pleurostoma richardsiae]|uniref:Stress response protein NST1 n=1 Tax=Pleurostoma richardsiae TaxID=41990 RepID=A0AA38VFL8_9PEZI|nr:Stress response protein NST1 [Pleurostoma richardsiae]